MKRNLIIDQEIDAVLKRRKIIMITKFEYEKETKNAIRFKEISDAPVIGILYVQKSALPALDYKKDDVLNVTISKEEKQ